MTTSTDRQQFREVLAGLASKTLTRIPTLNGRVEKACKLVLAGDVALHPDGTALVNSLTDPTRAYQVTGSPATCQCKDYDHAPEHLCAHRLSVGFLRKVQELLPPAVESTPEVHTGCTSPLPEAPVSITLKATLHNCVRHGPGAHNRAGHEDFRAHLAGRVAHVAMLNPARGARLRALFERIEWDPPPPPSPLPPRRLVD